jgi:hypothetical protein
MNTHCITAVLLLTALLRCPTVDAQPCSAWKRLSKAEKRWVIGHLFVAKRAYRISVEARDQADRMLTDLRLDRDKDGGEVDAFRHTYWMARLTQSIGRKKALKLGEAHELGNYQDYLAGKAEEIHLPDSMSSVMDRWNNRLGATIGEGCAGFSKDQLQERIVDEILNGRARKLRKNAQGEWLDCSGNPVDRTSRQWKKNSCLVRTGVR